MVGRQTPFLALIVPLILIGMVDGRRHRQAWPVAVIGGLTFARQFPARTTSRAHGHRRVALATASIVAFLRIWQPASR